MKQAQRPTCFISYCRDGVDRDTVDHLVQQLRQTSRQRVEFLYDEDLDAGAKLPAFMDMLRSVDGVILLLTPEYKTKTEDRLGGVYTEYCRRSASRRKAVLIERLAATPPAIASARRPGLPGWDS